MRRIVFRLTLVLVTFAVIAVGLLATSIYSFRNAYSDGSADAAVVLGAAAWTTGVSPVFRERINHGIDLYRNRKCES